MSKNTILLVAAIAIAVIAYKYNLLNFRGLIDKVPKPWQNGHKPNEPPQAIVK